MSALHQSYDQFAAFCTDLGSICCVLQRFGVDLLRSATIWCRFATLCNNLGSICFVLHQVDIFASSDRIIERKLNIKGGVLYIICHYAPHSAYSYEEKEQHWELLDKVTIQLDKRNPKLIIGDCNARLHARRQYETDIIGPYILGLSLIHI